MKRGKILNFGEIIFCNQQEKVHTAGVGSCLVIVIYDSKIKIGGVAHTMLPSKLKSDKLSTARGKYVDHAIPIIIERLEKSGGERGSFYASIIGGANMFVKIGNERKHIGEQNVEMAKLLLEEYKIPIKHEDTGGSCGRAVDIDFTDGKVEVISRRANSK